MLPALETICHRLIQDVFHTDVARLEGRLNYLAAKYSSEPVVAVFNHITFLDIGLLLSHIDGEMSFVGRKSHLSIFPVRHYAQALRCIEVPSNNPRRSVTDQITERARLRRFGDALLAIAPDAAETPVAGGPPISPFRSGAFVGGHGVLPIVLRFFPHPPYWPDGGGLKEAILERLGGGRLSVGIVILPVMNPMVYESLEGFKERVREAMIHAYLGMQL